MFKQILAHLAVSLVITVWASVVSAQIRPDALNRVPANDTAMPALREWQQKVNTSYARGGAVKARISDWYEMPFPSLKKLFPQQRFFTISWSEQAIPGQEKSTVGLAIGLEVTVICNSEGKLIEAIDHYGNYEPYGDFLAANKTAIRSPDDAQLVWEGFCDLHQKHWKDQPAEKISDTVWHLGNVTIRDVHYYYEVVLDSAKTVTSAKLHADDPKRPKPM